MYLPDDIQVWHLEYDNYPNGYRHKVWETKNDTWKSARSELMINRFQTLIYGKGDVSPLGRYGIGNARTIAEWGEAAGLNLVL